MNNKVSSKTFSIPILTGTLIITNAMLLGVVAKWVIRIMPILPGSSSNDPMVLYFLSALGVTFGILVLIGGLIVQKRPQRGKVLGMIILVFSAASIIMGGGFIGGCIAGIISGIKTIKKTTGLYHF